MVWLLRFTGALAIFPPLMLFAAPWIVPTGMYMLVGWLVIASLIGGISADGVGIASMTFLLEVSPPEQRPLYMGLANTLLGIGAVIPVAGGILVSTAGYAATFIIAALWSVVAIGISGSLRAQPQATAAL
jgi:MFS family permease